MSNSSNKTVQYSTVHLTINYSYVKHVKQCTLPYIFSCENCGSRAQNDSGWMGYVQGGSRGSRDWGSPPVTPIIEGDDDAHTTTTTTISSHATTINTTKSTFYGSRRSVWAVTSEERRGGIVRASCCWGVKKMGLSTVLNCKRVKE